MKNRTLAPLLAVLLACPISADAKISKQLHEELTGHIAPMAEETDTTARQALLLSRAILDGKKAQKELAAAQTNEDKRVRIAAGLGLLITGDKKAHTFISQELASDARLLETLEELVAALPDALEASVIAELWKSTTPDIKRVLARFAVAQSGPSFKVATDLLNGKSAEDRKILVEAMVFSAKPTSIDTLAALLKAKDDGARADAAQALVALSRHPELEASVRPHLVGAMGDKSATIRATIVRRLLEVRVPEAVTAAFEIAKGAETSTARIEWMEAILATGLRPKIEDAKPWLTSSDTEEKALAHELAAASRDEAFIKTLITMEQSTEFEPRMLALRALGRSGSPEASAIYSRTLFEALPEVRTVSAAGLAKLGREDSLGALERALKNEKDAQIRLDVIRAIGSIKSAKSVQVLRFQVTNNDARVKQATLQALRTIGLPEGATALDVLLRDRNSEIQWLAFLTALELNSAQAEKAMTQAFRNPPSTYLEDIRALQTKHRNMLINYMLTKTTGSTQSDAIRYAISYGGFDAQLREIAMDSTGSTGDRRAIFLYFGASSDVGNRGVLERVARTSAGPKPLVHLAAWLLTRPRDAGAEPTFRGYLGSSDPAVKAIGLYGIASIHH